GCCLIDAANLEVDSITNVVKLRILFCNLNCVRVNVAGVNRLVPSLTAPPGVGLLTLCRGNSQYASSGADVQKASAFVILIDRFQTQSRRFVRTRAKSHTGTDLNDDRVSTASVRIPTCRDSDRIK